MHNEGVEASEIIRHFVDISGYAEYAAIYEGGTSNAMENIKELKQVARESGNTIEDLVNEIAMCETKIGSEDGEDSDRVNMLTVHGAKGLEWPIVIVAGCSNRCFPNEDRVSVDYEEERRLFYVAMTRAKKNLIITYPVTYLKYGSFPERCSASKFVDEIDNEFIYQPKKTA